MTDYTHRDLCSATAGLLNAYLEMSGREHFDHDLDRDTVEAIARAFDEKHEELGAETPTTDLD